ncbi:MAG: hypothetical protein KAT25_06170 [Sulfuriflexus sp.]|nr:hypothetical protein [Sulfuriflexus sp.]
MDNGFLIVFGALVFGVLNLIVTVLAIGRIAEDMSLYFSAQLLIMAYVIVLALSVYFWPPLAIITTIFIWCFALTLIWIERRNDKKIAREKS